MSRERAILHYKAAMAVFAKWLASGMITEDELTAIEVMAAQKHGLPLGSIYR
jgi:hypothetical protein